MARLLLLIALALTPAHAGMPLLLIIDGQQIATLAGDGLVYDTGTGEIRITTHETVWGCRTDRVFTDQFEAQP